MPQEELFIADREFRRLDVCLSQLMDISRSRAQSLIDEGQVTLNGQPCRQKDGVKPGDCIRCTLPEVKTTELVPENIPLSIVYEDGDICVINKPRGMVVHPAVGNERGTLVNGLLFHFGNLSTIGGEVRPGIVHRIDKDTGGLLMVAKNDKAHLALAEQIKAHSFKREYRAVLLGNLKEDMGIVDRPIGRHPYDRKKQTVGGVNPRDAVTRWAVLERFNYFCDVKCVLETGRTHQIRVHMLSIGHPVAGDTVYGGEKNDFGLRGQCLFAAVLGFVHPTSGKYMEFEAPLPRWYADFIDRIRRSNW